MPELPLTRAKHDSPANGEFAIRHYDSGWTMFVTLINGLYIQIPVDRPGEPCLHKGARYDGSDETCWQWDGDEDKPTLNPSIMEDAEGKGWHGWIRQGVAVW